MACLESDQWSTTRTNQTIASNEDPIARALLRVWLAENAVETTEVVATEGFERRRAARRIG